MQHSNPSTSTDHESTSHETPSLKHVPPWALATLLLLLAGIVIAIHLLQPPYISRPPVIEQVRYPDYLPHAMELYVGAFGSPPPTMDALAQAEFVPPELHRDIRRTSYFYLPPTEPAPPEALVAIASFTKEGKQVHLVLDVGEYVLEIPTDAKLNELLARPENADFVEAYRAYQANQETSDRPNTP